MMLTALVLLARHTTDVLCISIVLNLNFKLKQQNQPVLKHSNTLKLNKCDMK